MLADVDIAREGCRNLCRPAKVCVKSSHFLPIFHFSHGMNSVVFALEKTNPREPYCRCCALILHDGVILSASTIVGAGSQALKALECLRFRV